MIGFFDIVFSIIGLILLLPLSIILSIRIVIDSKGDVVYKQTRIGKGGIDFNLYKFRSMSTGADKKGLITVGSRDASIEYMDENTILAKLSDADKTYIDEVMPNKIEYNMKYINESSLRQYFKIFFDNI